MRHDLLFRGFFDFKRNAIEFKRVYNEIIEEDKFGGEQDNQWLVLSDFVNWFIIEEFIREMFVPKYHRM